MAHAWSANGKARDALNGPNPELKKRVWIRFGSAPVVMGLVFFLPAGTLAYWQAWAYIALICVPLLFVVHYLFEHDPGLLETRLSQKEPHKTQRLIVGVGNLYYLVFLLPGLDHRFGWSRVPSWLAIAALAMVLVGYGMVMLVFRENSFASRVVTVVAGQRVVCTGPYAVVRHPMYVGTILMDLFTPLALGSYWALPAFALIVPLLMWRILDEERLLRKELPGYGEYAQRTRYRLVPGVW